MTDREIQTIIEKRIVRNIVLKVLENLGFTSVCKGSIISKNCPEDGGFKTKEGECNHPNHPDNSNGGSMYLSDITSDVEKQKKIDSINIDFDNDNILPGLNRETLEELGVEDKPVLLSKRVLEKNTNRHPEIPLQFFGDILGNALYKPNVVLKGHSERPYFNFIHSFGGDDNAVVLLQVKDTGSGFFEVVNFHLARDSSVAQKTNKERT